MTPEPKTESTAATPPGLKKKPTRWRRIRRFIRRVIIVLVLLLAAILVFLPWIVPAGFLRERIQRAVREQFGRDCDMSDVEISVWSGLVIHDFRLEEREGFGSQPTVRIARLQGEPHWAWMVHWQLAPKITLHDVEFNLVADEQGRFNVQDILDRFKTQPMPAGASVKIIGGRVLLRDMRHEKPFALTLLSVDLLPVARAGMICYDVECALRHLQKSGGGDIHVSSRAEFIPEALDRTFMRGDVAVEGLDVNALNLPEDLPVRPAAGRMSLKQSYEVDGSRFRVSEGLLSLDNATFTVPALSPRALSILPVKVEYELEGDVALGQVSLRKGLVVPGNRTSVGPGAYMVELEADVRDLYGEVQFDATVRPRSDLQLLFSQPEQELAREVRDLFRRELRGQGKLIKALRLAPDAEAHLRESLGMLADSLPFTPAAGLFGGTIRASKRSGELRASGDIGWKDIAIIPSLDGSGTLPGMTFHFTAVATPAQRALRVSDFSVESPMIDMRGSASVQPQNTDNAASAQAPPRVALSMQSEIRLERMVPNAPEGIVLRIFSRNVARKLSIDPERYLGALSPRARRFYASLPEHMKQIEKFEVRGVIRTGLSVDGPMDRLTLTGFADGTSADVRLPKTFRKKAGMPMRTDFALTATPEEVSVSLPVVSLLRLNATARGTWRRAENAADIHFAVIDFAGFSPAEVLEHDNIPDIRLVGGLRLDADLTDLGSDRARVDGTVRLGNLSVMDASRPDKTRITLHGAIDFTPKTMKTRYPLVLLIADSIGLLEFHVQDVLKDEALSELLSVERDKRPGLDELVDRPTLTFRLSSPSLDVRPLEQPGAPPPTIPEDLSSLTEVLKRTQIDGTVSLASLISSTDNVSAVDGILSMRRGEGILRLGRFRWDYSGGRMVYDGTAIDLLQSPAEFYLYSRAENLMPGPMVNAMVEKQFPGLTFKGRLSMLTTMRGRLYNDPVKLQGSLTGSGSTSVHEGTLRGKSLPDYIGRFFPGLNYSNYSFKKMENHVYFDDGVACNDMYFHGSPTDVFVVGRTKPDGQIDYTMGIDFSGERRHRLLNPLLLRVPLMRYTGRIVGDQFEDQDIFFVPPHELAALLATQGTLNLLAKGPVDWRFLEKWRVPGGKIASDVLDAMWIPGWFFKKGKP